MAIGKSVPLFLLVLASASVEAHTRGAHQPSGRKLFGGYRIVPKVCQPTIPSRVKSDQPAICMFNYECTRRNGEVVGACMDGFLFGACCQLPPKEITSHEKITPTDDLYHLEPIDHVPEIPILLNPEDGTPIGITLPQTSSTVKIEDRPGQGTVYTKISTLTPSSTSKKPGFAPSHSHDSVQNAERPQIQMQPDISHLMEDIPLLLGQQNFIDELSLPGLLTHSDSNNDIQEHQDNSVNPVTTLLSPDQVLQIADPVDQLPALFSQGIGQSNHTSAETILLNENGTALDEANNPDDLFKPGTETPYTTITEMASERTGTTTEKVRVTESAMTTDQRKKITEGSVSPGTSTTQWVRFPDRSTLSTMSTEERTQTPSMSKLPMVTQMYANTQRLTTTPPETEYTVQEKYEKVSTIEERVSTKELEALSSINQEATTPMTASSEKDELVRVPTITYGTPSGNKKNDVVDKEELAINHIISILNGTTPASDNSATVHQPSSSIHTWVSIDETAKPNSQKTSTTRLPGPTSTGSHTFPYTFYRPSTYYNYETVPTSTSYSSLSTMDSYSSRPSTQTSYGGTNSYGYSARPTTNPPAPTVIVLGPLGTEYTTETTTKSAATRRPIGETSRPSLITARPTASSSRPVPLSTKKPSVSTTITHNISTVISNVATNNNRVVSTSVITVNLKDGTSAKPTVSTDLSTEAILDDNSLDERVTTKRPSVWTTLSSWSEKPSFHLKPSTPPVVLSEENLTPVNTVVFKDSTTETTSGAKATTPTPCDEETAAPDDLINFPPVRNPNLNISGSSVSQQEKPLIPELFNHTRYPDLEIISENDIPTPTFVEDDVLTNKVDTFVNKIVESLQSNFQGLKEVVYSRNNVTTTTVAPTVTKRPVVVTSTTKRPFRRPTSTAKPLSLTTRRPTTTRRPIRPSSPRPIPTDRPRPKPTTPRPRPSTAHSVTTKKPSITTRRTKPTRKPTTTLAPSTEAVVEEETTSVTLLSETSTLLETHSAAPGDFRKQCGIRPLVRTGKIVGGKSAEFGEWPWQVLVREATWLGLFTKNKCGGVLITDKFVLTAAHCQPGFLAALVAVFGEFDLSGEREEKRSLTRNVRNVIVNRAYNPTTFENDLALLELETPVQFDEHIVPICMPDEGIDFTGRMATVTGWGRLKYNGGVPSTLQEVEVPIMENSVCQEMFLTAGYSKLILDSFLCAGYATGQKDSCEGDSGGPLVMQRPDGRWFLVGTVSHGIKCASPYLPGVYMRTSHFKPWLNKVTGVV